MGYVSSLEGNYIVYIALVVAVYPNHPLNALEDVVQRKELLSLQAREHFLTPKIFQLGKRGENRDKKGCFFKKYIRTWGIKGSHNVFTVTSYVFLRTMFTHAT